MIKRGVLGIFLLLLIVGYGCSKDVYPSQEILETAENISTEITAIEVTSGYELIFDNELEVGQIVIETNKNIQKYIKSESKDNKLTFELDRQVNMNEDLVLRLYVSTKQFNNITASGGASVETLSTIKASSFRITLSGSSFINAAIESDDIYLSISGASRVNFIGSATNLHITECSGGSSINTLQLPCDNAIVNVSGASELTVNIKESISGTCSGSSMIKYSTSSLSITNSVELSGNSTIEKIMNMGV